jgi:hypothetical protein
MLRACFGIAEFCCRCGRGTANVALEGCERCERPSAGVLIAL